jgi:hypothetical protein
MKQSTIYVLTIAACCVSAILTAHGDDAKKNACEKVTDTVRNLPKPSLNPVTSAKNVYYYGKANVKQMGKCLDSVAKGVGSARGD